MTPSLPNFAVRIVVAAVLGGVAGVLMGETLVLLKQNSAGHGLIRILSAVSGILAGWFLAVEIAGWSWIKRGVVVGMLAPAIGALLVLGALSPGGVLLAPFVGIVLWPLFFVTIPAGVSASFVYSRLVARLAKASPRA